MNDYLHELQENWRDAYWWADHQIELAVLLALVAGVLGLAFKWAEIRLELAMKGGG